MPLSDYVDFLAEIALGWLGWSEEETLSADMNAIEVAHAGRVAMLSAIFGGGKEDKPVELPAFTPGAMRSLSRA
jgi:type IV secretory pathway VirJ component